MYSVKQYVALYSFWTSYDLYWMFYNWRLESPLWTVPLRPPSFAISSRSSSRLDGLDSPGVCLQMGHRSILWQSGLSWLGSPAQTLLKAKTSDGALAVERCLSLFHPVNVWNMSHIPLFTRPHSSDFIGQLENSCHFPEVTEFIEQVEYVLRPILCHWNVPSAQRVRCVRHACSDKPEL